ncbi:hypothetical protein ACHAO4_009778 [Trichoderma viride]
MLAQRLQIRYVWIDSLCIIQKGDGGEDWRAEALAMDQVYQNSFCNVSADWGSGKRGLYFERDLRLVDKPQIDWKVRREPNLDVVVVEKCTLVENEFWEEQVSRSPLSVRGWVVQERWLSPRNLRFGTREVFFECAQTTFCERFPDKFPEALLEGGVILKAAFSKLQTTQNQSNTLGPATPGTELYNAWGDVLAKYSRCHLTFASDRAVVFAGIAKFFRALVNDNYVAGLWLRNLASEMMWFRNRLLTKAVVEDARDRLSLFQHDQANQYRAPSFSWASSAIPVEPNHAKGNSGFLVVVKCVKFRDTQNALVEEWTDNLYGPLLHPIVEIQAIGTLKKWRLKPYFDGKETDLYVVPDGPGQDSKKLKAWSDAISRDTTEATLDFQLDIADIAAWAAKDNLYYIPWQDHWRCHLPADRNGEHPDDDFLTCLLLELVDTQMSRFRRIGRLYIHDKSQRKLYIAKQENEASLPCAHFDPTTRRHTVYII